MRFVPQEVAGGFRVLDSTKGTSVFATLNRWEADAAAKHLNADDRVWTSLTPAEKRKATRKRPDWGYKGRSRAR